MSLGAEIVAMRVDSWRYRRRTGAVALAGTLMLVTPLSGSVQEVPCDKGLLVLARGPQGYAPHGDRCEGIYAQQVSGTILRVASLTASFEEYELMSGTDLTVEWTAPGDSAVRLRAQGVEQELYYRMDTSRPPESRSYHWPSDVLAAQHIARGDIGVLGWTRCSLGGVARDVYVPLRIRQHHAADSTSTNAYDLVLLPAVTLKEVYLTLAVVGPDGLRSQVLRNGEPLDVGYYPAERPVKIRLGGFGATGIYYLEIGAELESGGAVTLTQWIYHVHGPAPH
jgi:hypothetical protein